MTESSGNEIYEAGEQTPAEVKQDARSRAIRTLFIGLAMDVALALATVLLPLLATLDISSKAQWLIIGTTLLKTAISATISYFLRLKVAPKDPKQITLADAVSAWIRPAGGDPTLFDNDKGYLGRG